MKSSILLLLGLLGLAGCTTTHPSPELVNARQAYERARTSQAAQAAPDSLVSAKQALDKAEAAYMDDAGSMEERSLAYVAERRSMRAVAEGNQRIARQVKNAADQQYAALQSEMRQEAEQRLEQASGQVSEMEREQRQRTQATETTIQKLARLAQVKEDARGIVITVSGGMLFKTGSSNIMSSANSRLDEIARVLSEQNGRSITVEGHTDSRGSEELNQKLSQERAEAVRDYLVKEGVPADRVTAVGKGEGNPIASNDTTEGRAANRRVEIVVSNGGQQQQQQSPQGTTPSR
jgi:outer membrane protein OmpA-like peptidoglycan-associated protein